MARTPSPDRGDLWQKSELLRSPTPRLAHSPAPRCFDTRTVPSSLKEIRKQSTSLLRFGVSSNPLNLSSRSRSVAHAAAWHKMRSDENLAACAACNRTTSPEGNDLDAEIALSDPRLYDGFALRLDNFFGLRPLRRFFSHVAEPPGVVRALTRTSSSRHCHSPSPSRSGTVSAMVCICWPGVANPSSRAIRPAHSSRRRLRKKH